MDDTSKLSSPSPPSPSRNEALEDLQNQLSTLALHAEALFSKQPRATYLQLTSETRDIYNKYRQHGSQARLSHNLMQFLTREDDEMRFVDVTKAEEADEKVSMQNTDSPKTDMQARQLLSHLQAGETPSLTTSSSTSKNTPSDSSNDLRTIDESSARLTATLPFHPADVTLTIPSTLHLPPAILTHISHILSLHNLCANAQLHHHTTKYGPLPIFRLGISALLTSRLDSIFEPAANNSLGLTPETRAFLRDVYETQPELNITEARLLSRAARVPVATVQMFWEDMNWKRGPYWAMRAVVARLEVERGRAEGRVGASWDPDVDMNMG